MNTKQLIIAEKPSVAQDISRALGGFTKKKDYFESDDYVLSSAVGHLLELSVPEEFEVKRGKWTFPHLPVIPPHFAVRPLEKTEARLKLLIRLIKRKDVTGLINACDAGREGELIFNFIAQHAGTKKPMQRLWLQSMTPQAIRNGFTHLRAAQEVEGLRNAAICRAESDWLIGVNGTRAMTAFNSKTGGFQKTPVGRVQTPTLAMVVEREDKIRKFKPRDYWELKARFGCSAGEYPGRWFEEKFTKPEGDEHATAFRLWDKAQAEAIRAKCEGKQGVVTEEAKPSTQLSPLMFDLTSLQREANGRFGFSARATLQVAQALYERHKVLTYPRTDARALPEDYIPTVKEIIHNLRDTYAPFANEITKQGWVKPNKRIFNNTKISDHFAIIPTGTLPSSLSEAEQKIYDLVTKRFLAVFYPAAKYKITTRITRVEGEAFKTEGKVLVNPGWLAVYGKEAANDEKDANDGVSPQLVGVKQGETASTQDIVVKSLQTNPLARFNEASLLSAMEGAGKMVDDEELRAAMVERGLGTPATRAQIIEGLINEQYIHRDGRELIPSAKAFSLITLLKGLGVTALTSPELTGAWEYKLSRMERGELSREAFMQEIAAMAREVVERAKRYESDTVPGDFATLQTPCPKCSGVVKENYKKFTCQRCDWSTWKIVAGRQFEIDEIETLLRTGRVGPLRGFRSKQGKSFTTMVILDEAYRPVFEPNRATSLDTIEEAVSSVVLGVCPKCGGRVFEWSKRYACENARSLGHECDFKIATSIHQQPIDVDTVTTLLRGGRTPLLTGFRSPRSQRRYQAALSLDSHSKLQFHFKDKPRQHAQ